MIFGGRDFISWVLTGVYLDDVENWCDDDEIAVIEEGIGDLGGHWQRRSGPATLKPLGCIVSMYPNELTYTSMLIIMK